MPYKCKLMDGKWRVVKPDSGRVAKNAAGTALDGGGHPSEGACIKQMRALYWSESKEPKNSSDIFAYGIVGVDLTPQMVSAILNAVEKEREVRIRINSRGGSFLDAIAIFNMIKERGNVITYIEGAALSAAGVIALSGSRILMAQNGLMMLHRPMMPIEGKTADQLRAQAEILDKAQVALVDTIKAKCKKSDKDIEDMLEAETWFTSYEAYNYGLVDEIVEISNVSVDLNDIPCVPDVILNHVKSKGDKAMPMKALLAKLGLHADESATEDQMVDLIINSVIIKENKEDKTVPPGIKTIVKRYRETEINNLVSTGKITGAVANDLKLHYCADAILDTVIKDDGNASDDFDTIIQALGKNEPILSFGGKSGTQPLNKGADKKNALLTDMESRK